MNYALLPFLTVSKSKNDEGYPDLRECLRNRSGAHPINGIANLELLDHLVELLQDLPWNVLIDICHEDNGQLHLAVTASDLGRNLELDDRVNAGFFLQNDESSKVDLLACTRLYRVACQNGALLECEEEQTVTITEMPAAPSVWKKQLQEVVERSFDNEGVDIDLARFRATTEKMVLSPYEYLCHLESQGLIDGDEQHDIQVAFADAGDQSLYGFINAVTQVAHRLRANDNWIRALHFERLGGQILRGDHHPPASYLVPTY